MYPNSYYLLISADSQDSVHDDGGPHDLIYRSSANAGVSPIISSSSHHSDTYTLVYSGDACCNEYTPYDCVPNQHDTEGVSFQKYKYIIEK